MPNQVATNRVIRFATFEVDLQAQELRRAGLRLRLPSFIDGMVLPRTAVARDYFWLSR